MNRLKRRLLLFVLLPLLASCAEEDVSEEPAFAYVESHYRMNDGTVGAYPDDRQAPRLSESLGQYLEYLVSVGEQTLYEEQVKRLEDDFLADTPAGSAVRWELNEGASANALIDDVRIAAALRDGAEKFKKPAYGELAERILLTIRTNQLNDGVITDFLSWDEKQAHAAETVTLSYLTPDFFSLFPDAEANRRLLEDMPGGDPFFPETYQVASAEWVLKSEIHMVDQLLIANNRSALGIDSPEFKEWLIREWSENGRLSGRYVRESGKPVEGYEALSVYALAVEYLESEEEKETASEIRSHADGIVGEGPPSGLHVFDYLYYLRMNRL